MLGALTCALHGTRTDPPERRATHTLARSTVHCVHSPRYTALTKHEDNRITHRTELSAGPRRPGQRSACLIVIYGEGLGKRLDVDARQVLIGRSEEADLQLPHPSISRRHCLVWRQGSEHRIRDLGATNPTRLNDQPLGDTESVLKDGDHITIGESILKFIGHASVEAPYHEEVYQLATHDPLTDLCNRRHFRELLDKEIARALRYQRALSACIIDIDLFKQINDTFGHIEGDGVLRRIADIIQRHARVEDVAARIGGEEFAMVFPETDLEGARLICERLRTAVEQARFASDEHFPVTTISIGIAELGEDCDTLERIMQAADMALYRAKNEGRNRVCLATRGGR